MGIGPYMGAHLLAAGPLEVKKSRLFRFACGRTGEFIETVMNRVAVFCMIKCCSRDAGFGAEVCCYAFRANGITAYLGNGGSLENAQVAAAHKRLRTTKLYDPTGNEITLDELKRIAI